MQTDIFIMRISDDGKGIPPQRMQHGISHGLASMRHRITGLGGTWDMRNIAAGGTLLTATIPLARMLRTEQASGEAAPPPLTRTGSNMAGSSAIELR